MISLTKAYFDETLRRRFVKALKKHDFRSDAYTGKFAKKFISLYGLTAGICVNSGTSALIVSLVALGVAKDDEVITTVYTCKAILDAIYFIGAKPRFVDCLGDYKTMNFNLDEADAARKINPKVKVIIVPYTFGKIPAYEILWKLGVPVIEDVTLSLGAEIGEPKTDKRIVVCSFHSSKMISAFEGGIVASNDKLFNQKVSSLVDILAVNEDEREKRQDEIVYQTNFSFRPSEFNFIYGFLQLELLNRFIKERQKIAKRYIDELDKNKYELPVFEQGTTYYRFIIGMKKPNVPGLLGYLREHGITAGRGVYPLLSDYRGAEEKFPNAEITVSKSISVPLYPGLKENEAAKIIKLLNNYEG
jgi:dTDP-4-amino-4,6-dideoxygalactose transaminase